MKQLVCEMCGSTDLVKQDGVFVCQTCGCKYSVEEARKMMIEGTVDVSGSVVKIDSTEKLKNLYTLARRAKDDGNASDAARYYNEIRVEDPNSWEAAFYAVYFAALDIRIAQIAPAARSVSNCLDSVMGLIKKGISEERQKEAYVEVASCALALGKTLSQAACESFREIGKSGGFSNIPDSICDSFNERINAACGVMLDVAVSIYGHFDDAYTAKAIIDNACNYCDSNYLVMTSYFEMKKFRESLEQRINTIQKEAIERYWEEHAEEKRALEAERKSLYAQIDVVKQRKEQQVTMQQELMNTIPEITQISNLEERIGSLTAYKDSLGLFKGKEKKLIQTQIDQVVSEKEDAQTRLNQAKADIEDCIKSIEEDEKACIAPIQSRIDAITEELIKNR